MVYVRCNATVSASLQLNATDVVLYFRVSLRGIYMGTGLLGLSECADPFVESSSGLRVSPCALQDMGSYQKL